ncbi:MAG: HIT domain-containing protein [Candidatus Omnitrophota bacterium]
MNQLWAPWRIGYLKSFKKAKGCLFCRVFKSKNDKSNLIVARSAASIALLNLYPYSNGHILVAPAKHSRSLDLLTDRELLDLFGLVNRAKKLLDRVLKPDGYNIGLNIGRAGGAGFDQHLHVHVVPRWTGDINFMPILAKTKIISQSLTELHKELTQRYP